MKSIFLLCIPVFLLIGSCERNHSLKNKSLTEQLLEGNKRFAAGCPIHPDDTPNRRRAIQNKQNPFVVVISCSDSRVSPEIIFDQGLGSIFSIRTAGNVIGDLELGSVEYAIEHLNCKLVVVLGHDHCGAIEAYLSHSKHSKHFGHIEKIIEYIDHEDEQKVKKPSNKSNLDFAVNANIKHGLNLLNHSNPEFTNLLKTKKVKVIGALYHLDNGKVEVVN